MNPSNCKLKNFKMWYSSVNGLRVSPWLPGGSNFTHHALAVFDFPYPRSRDRKVTKERCDGRWCHVCMVTMQTHHAGTPNQRPTLLNSLHKNIVAMECAISKFAPFWTAEVTQCIHTSTSDFVGLEACIMSRPLCLAYSGYKNRELDACSIAVPANVCWVYLWRLWQKVLQQH